MRPCDLLSMLKDAANEWLDDNGMRLSAALAYYAIFSLAPLLVITVAVVAITGNKKDPPG